MVPYEDSAPARRLAPREDRRRGLTPGFLAVWLGAAVLAPAAIYGLWAAPVMRFMDSLRRSDPKADWVIALHGGSLPVFYGALGLVLLTALATCLLRRREAAQQFLLAGCGAILVGSLGVLALAWI